MCFVHHVRVRSETIELLRRFIAAYESEHPGVITRHAVGYLGKNYLIFATENIAEAVRQLGIPCGSYYYQEVARGTKRPSSSSIQ
jgi:hypothetical protein